jgi:hypothetical protein
LFHHGHRDGPPPAEQVVEIAGHDESSPLWQRQGHCDEARAALAAVYGTYTEGFTTLDLVDAKALLDSMA